VEVTLQATPSTLQSGTATQLNWTAKNADHCVASGAWSDPVGTSGSRTMMMNYGGSHDYVLTCGRGGNSSIVTLPLTLSP
jgi:hypothetical protein